MKEKNMFKIFHVQLKTMVEVYGTKKVDNLLSTFLSSQNNDVTQFLIKKAIIFEKSNKSTTYLILGIHNEELEILAYYTLAIKSFRFIGVSRSSKKKIVGQEHRDDNYPSILVGQVGRNDNASYKIEGKEIFKSIFEKIIETISLIGGTKFIYIESINCDKVIKRYENYGFKKLMLANGKPSLTTDNLVQMILPVEKLIEIVKF
ncbi:MAG: hypothetical protein RBQ97_01640 [Acholeplasma sp.]|nr:hypothetical protein [Acholeplasma sp.]